MHWRGVVLGLEIDDSPTVGYRMWKRSLGDLNSRMSICSTCRTKFLNTRTYCTAILALLEGWSWC